MTCPSLRHHYADYADGALPPGEGARMEAHLRACPACGDDYRAYAGVCELLHGLPSERAPFGFADRVRFALRHEEAELGAVERAPWRLFAPRAVLSYASAAAVLLAALGVAYVGQSRKADFGAPAEESVSSANPRPAVPPPPSEATAEQVAEKVAEIEALVADINALAAKAQEPILLTGDADNELVFDPNAIYYRANQPVIGGAAAAAHAQP